MKTRDRTRSNHTIYEAFAKGQDAYRDRKRIEDNDYEPISPLHACWLQGYEAERDIGTK